MTQQARPSLDLFNIGWSPQPGWPENPLSMDLQGNGLDTWFVEADLAAQGSTFEVFLSPLASPVPGPQTLTVRLEQFGGIPSGQPVTVLLMQGSTLIARRTVPVTGAFANNDFTLTPAEVQAITDYTNLRAVVSIGSPTTKGCAQLSNGAALLLNFTPSGLSNGTCDDCAGLNVPTTLVYASDCVWLATAVFCGRVTPQAWSFSYDQSSGLWVLGFGGGNAAWTAASWDGKSPLTLTLSYSIPSGNCTNFPNTITLTPP